VSCAPPSSSSQDFESDFGNEKAGFFKKPAFSVVSELEEPQRHKDTKDTKFFLVGNQPDLMPEFS
jgi:hypothetical protein